MIHVLKEDVCEKGSSEDALRRTPFVFRREIAYVVSLEKSPITHGLTQLQTPHDSSAAT